MASTASFDIVSQYDQQEFKNALDQTEREIATRYDLKDSNTELEHADHQVTLTTRDEYTAQAARDIFETKLLRRGLSLKILEYQEEETASGGQVRQVIKLKEGIPSELAKDLTKKIRDQTKKVTPQIQGDAVRVQGKSKDDLQTVIQFLKAEDLPVALQFVNFR